MIRCKPIINIMKPTLSIRALSASLKPGLSHSPNNVPYRASRANLIVNIAVTSLYGISLYTFYKDYMTTKRATYHRLEVEGKNKPSFLKDIKKEVHDAPNRLFHPSKEEDQVERGNLWRTLHSLTYGDVSMFCLGWGFLIQFCNVGLATQGKKSFVFRSGLGGVLAFPLITYYICRERLHKMEYEGVQIY